MAKLSGDAMTKEPGHEYNGKEPDKSINRPVKCSFCHKTFGDIFAAAKHEKSKHKKSLARLKRQET